MQMPPLLTALKSKDRETAFRLLTSGASLNEIDTNFETPLHIATRNGDLEIITLLIQKGATIDCQNDYGDTPSHIAAREGQLEIVKVLIEKRANIDCQNDYGDTPLHIAAREGQLEIVKALIEKGANIDCQDNNGNTPLYMAAKKGQLEIVKALTEKGANIDYPDNYGDTPLHIAAREGHLKIVEVLANKGADIAGNNIYGFTALHYAACKGRVDIIKYLKTHKAELLVGDNNGNTPLHLAAQAGQLSSVEWLIANTTNINITNNNGETPLHCAIESENLAVIDTLLKEKARIDLITHEHLTPFYYSLQTKNLSLVHWLLKANVHLALPPQHKNENPLLYYINNASNTLEITQLLLAYLPVDIRSNTLECLASKVAFPTLITDTKESLDHLNLLSTLFCLPINTETMFNLAAQAQEAKLNSQELALLIQSFFPPLLCQEFDRIFTQACRTIVRMRAIHKASLREGYLSFTELPPELSVSVVCAALEMPRPLSEIMISLINEQLNDSLKNKKDEATLRTHFLSEAVSLLETAIEKKAAQQYTPSSPTKGISENLQMEHKQKRFLENFETKAASKKQRLFEKKEKPKKRTPAKPTLTGPAGKEEERQEESPLR